MKKFNVEKETNNIINFIRKYYKDNNLSGVIIGISGGKDSAVVAAIMVEALGRENVIGVTLPCHSSIKDKIDAKLIGDYYGFKLIDFDLSNTFDAFKGEVKNLGCFSKDDLENSDINLKPRLRMASLYYLAALYTSLYNKKYIVAGT